MKACAPNGCMWFLWFPMSFPLVDLVARAKGASSPQCLLIVVTSGVWAYGILGMWVFSLHLLARSLSFSDWNRLNFRSLQDAGGIVRERWESVRSSNPFLLIVCSSRGCVFDRLCDLGWVLYHAFLKTVVGLTGCENLRGIMWIHLIL